MGGQSQSRQLARVADRAERRLILERLSAHMLFAEEAPWQIIEMQLDDLEAYL